eukprot:TRINITY_DN15134_c0_g1_i1.p1 TRINITY_DN15134_c0_g1~~TRINITY_DN15134_c0_g1_i1.p1  ORF type:complete len:180 (-),score=60.67 TRINITY_DN15134_c0_g1_i1:148-687(-)
MKEKKEALLRKRRSELRYECIQINENAIQHKIKKENGMSLLIPLILYCICLVLSLIIWIEHWKRTMMIAFSIAIVFKWLVIDKEIMEESITVISNLGIQLESINRNGSSSQEFIDRKKIKQVVLNEVIQSFKVIYCLALVMEGKSNMILAFPNLNPRLEMLKPIFATTHRMIFNHIARN